MRLVFRAAAICALLAVVYLACAGGCVAQGGVKIWDSIYSINLQINKQQAEPPVTVDG